MIQPQCASCRRLIAGCQLPRVYRGEAGRNRFEHPDRDAENVEEQQIRKQVENAAVLGDKAGALRAQRARQLTTVSFDADSLLFPPTRLPLQARSPVEPVR